MNVRTRWLVTGLLFGGLWYLNKDEPAWEHGLKMLLVMVILVPAAERLLHRVRAARGKPMPVEINFRYLVPAKILLVLVALAVQSLLVLVTAAAGLIVAIGIVVVVAVGGARLNDYLVRPRAVELG